MKTLVQYQHEIVRVFEEYTKQGTKPWTYKIAAFDLSYQIGSLAKRIAQLDGERYSDGLTPEEIKEKIADELADIFAEVLFISHELQINLDSAWNKMTESDQKKISERS